MALSGWVEFFQELEHIRGRSKNTVMAYRRDLELFDDYFMKESDLHGIYDFMIQKKLSPRSQARVISSIRTYYKFLESRGEKIPDLSKLRPPRVEAKLPTILRLQDFNALMDACLVQDPLKSARNQITLLMLFGLGCRVTELIDLNLEDYFPSESWLKVKGKGNKERMIPMPQHLVDELNYYLKDVHPHLNKCNSKSILLNDRGNRPSRVDVWRWLDAWSARAGFETTMNPHKFRHGCATALLESGADLRSIQQLLGHSSIQTTQIYTTVTTTQTRDTIDKHHPWSQIDTSKSTKNDFEI